MQWNQFGVQRRSASVGAGELRLLCFSDVSRLKVGVAAVACVYQCMTVCVLLYDSLCITIWQCVYHCVMVCVPLCDSVYHCVTVCVSL